MEKSLSQEPKKSLKLQDLLKENPDIVLAKEIMEQSRKTEKVAIDITQNNYYKIPQT